MTNSNYTRDILKNFSRTQLHKICDKLYIARRRSKEDCIVDILAKQPQLIAQAQLNAHIEAQSETVAPEQQRMENNRQGYQDAVAGLSMRSNDHCYRMGYERGLRDVSPMPEEDTSSKAIAFDKIGSTIYGGVWEAFVNGTLIRIVAVQGGYRTNLTGDAVLVDFGAAVKESLLALARYRSNLDKFFPHEIQELLGMKFVFDEEEQTVFGEFEYRSIEFSVIQDREESEWRVVRKWGEDFVLVFSDSPSNFTELFPPAAPRRPEGRRWEEWRE
ncbi:hypothetical protein LC593_35895 [Nostoc sp. CHAB 5844]|nr:hypothetical protein [Nostoc sp. CHAB 5844]